MAMTSIINAQVEPYDAIGCQFLFTLGYTDTGVVVKPPTHASITCVNGLNHDPNNLLGRGKGNNHFTYCDGDLLVVQKSSATNVDTVAGCVMGSGPFKSTPPPWPGSHKNIVMKAGMASTTYTLKAECGPAGSSVDAIGGGATGVPAPSTPSAQ